MFTDEFQSGLCRCLRQQTLIGGIFYNCNCLPVYEPGQRYLPAIYLPLLIYGIIWRPHIIGIGDTLIDIEAVVVGQITGPMTKVPLAETSRSITGILEHLGHGILRRVQGFGFVRKTYSTIHSHTLHSNR